MKAGQINLWVKDHGGWIAAVVLLAAVVGTYVDLKTDISKTHEELAVFRAESALKLDRMEEDNKAFRSSIDTLTAQSRKLQNHTLVIRQALNIDPSIADTSDFRLLKELIAARKRAEAMNRN